MPERQSAPEDGMTVTTVVESGWTFIEEKPEPPDSGIRVNGWDFSFDSWMAEVSPGRWVSIHGTPQKPPNFRPCDVMTLP
jgi:hypothetical protein